MSDGDILELDSLGPIAEGVNLECKLAQGRDGQGELPRDFWPTYSAFANTPAMAAEQLIKAAMAPAKESDDDRS